jgi:hypothetical protein
MNIDLLTDLFCSYLLVEEGVELGIKPYSRGPLE